MTTCIFCGNPSDKLQGDHHILPQSTCKLLTWPEKEHDGVLTNRKVPLCMECHVKLTWLQQPLMNLIRHFVKGTPIPREFAFMVDEVWYELNKL